MKTPVLILLVAVSTVVTGQGWFGMQNPMGSMMNTLTSKFQQPYGQQMMYPGMQQGGYMQPGQQYMPSMGMGGFGQNQGMGMGGFGQNPQASASSSSGSSAAAGTTPGMGAMSFGTPDNGASSSSSSSASGQAGPMNAMNPLYG